MVFHVFTWCLGPVVQTIIATVMYRRGAHREYPLFFGYTLFVLVTSVIQLIMVFGQKKGFASYEAYFWFFWICEAVGHLLVFWLLFTVFRSSFAPYPRLNAISSTLYLTTTAAMLAFAIGVAVMSPKPDSHWLISSILSLDRSSELLRGGLMVFLIVFSNWLGVRLPHFQFGIAVGFGVGACLDVAAIAFRTHMGQSANVIYSTLRSVSYDLTTLIWLYYVLAPAREPVASTVPSHDEVRAWNRSFKEMLQR